MIFINALCQPLSQYIINHLHLFRYNLHELNYLKLRLKFQFLDNPN